jgi:hypothetical protein
LSATRGAVELLDEHILAGPARDPDGVEIGDAVALRRKPLDRRLQQRALLRIRRFLFRGGFAFSLALSLALAVLSWDSQTSVCAVTLQSPRR